MFHHYKPVHFLKKKLADSPLLLQFSLPSSLRWLALFSLLAALILLEQVLWWDNSESYRNPGLRPVSFAVPYFLGVLLLGYYRSVFGKGKQGLPSLWHWLPGIFFLLKNTSFYLSHLGVHLPHWHHHPAFVHHGYEVTIYLLVAHLWGYAVWVYLRYFPSIELDKPLLRWHHLLTGSVVLTGAVLLGFRQVYVLGWMTPALYLFFALLTLLPMAAVCWLVRQGIGQAVETTESPTAKTKYKNSALTPEAATELAERIRQVFEKENLYSDSSLSLDSLAGRMGVSRHHVSQAINSVFDLSFSDWVGKRRVEEAILLFKEYPSKSLIIKEIAYQVGFSNKTSFTLAFKKWTGKTPSAYRAGLEEWRTGETAI